MGKGGESKTKSGVLKNQKITAEKINTDGNGQIYQLADMDDQTLQRCKNDPPNVILVSHRSGTSPAHHDTNLMHLLISGG